MKQTLTRIAPTALSLRRAVNRDQAGAMLIEENYCERMHYSLRLPTTLYHRDDRALWFSTGINLPIQFLNSLYRYGLETTDPYTEIADRLAMVKYPQSPLYWLIDESQYAAGQGAYLEEQGAQALGAVWGMTANLDPELGQAAVTPGLTFQRVSTVAQVSAFVDTLLAAEEVSPVARRQWIDWEVALGLAADLPWQRYLAYRQGVVVATAALFYGTQTVGLYHIATRPQARGQGIGSAIARFALQQALAHDYRQGILIATPPGVVIYQRLGFQVVQTIHAYRFG